MTCLSLFVRGAGMAYLLLMAACSGEAPNAAPAVATAVPAKVNNVSVATVERQSLTERFTLPGTLEAWEDLTLSAELAGAVRRIKVDEGASLAKGETILRIDPETYEANLNRDQVAYDLALRQQQRLERLFSQQLVSEQEREAAGSAVEAAAADLKRSQVAFDNSFLRSPVAGRLDRLYVDRGEYVPVGTAAARVVQIDRLKVLVDVPEKDISFLKVGEEVALVPAVIEGIDDTAAFPATILHLGYTADPSTRTYRAKLEVDNALGRLRPGMIVRVSFIRRALSDVVVIPLYAVVDRDGEKVVFLDMEGKARLQPIQTGTVVDDLVEVRNGLVGGERLIVKGQHLLSDGAVVTVVER
ncbi:MAG: hypothetical protein C0621_00895 [Desulfuromonas sp.]|nr:MAG: hypothetical protein C0621_00895 [Desulfuromonas sp.]